MRTSCPFEKIVNVGKNVKVDTRFVDMRALSISDHSQKIESTYAKVEPSTRVKNTSTHEGFALHNYAIFLRNLYQNSFLILVQHHPVKKFRF